MTTDLRRWRFFLESAGYCSPPGRAACALALARAERDGELHGLEFWWEDDQEAWDGDGPAPRYLLNCVCVDADGKPLAALCGIGLNDTADDYRRVVQAELAADALDELASAAAAATPRL
jgi:hypothetical protein